MATIISIMIIIPPIRLSEEKRAKIKPKCTKPCNSFSVSASIRTREVHVRVRKIAAN